MVCVQVEREGGVTGEVSGARCEGTKEKTRLTLQRACSGI